MERLVRLAAGERVGARAAEDRRPRRARGEAEDDVSVAAPMIRSSRPSPLMSPASATELPL
jgi:hypothetical protein